MSESVFEKLIRNGSFVITSDCVPPRGADADTLAECAKMLAGKVSAISVPESEDGVRMSSLAASKHLADLGAEPIFHVLTRDQNRIALQSAILGAASLGIKNIFCTAGRHQALTTSGSARGVYDIDPVQLLQIASSMRNDGKLADGNSIDKPLNLLLGTDTNPFADPMELQVIALEKAVRAGADFILTAPVFDLDKFNLWMTYVRERGIHEKTAIVASVMPIISAADAVSLAEKYTYIDISDDIVKRLDSASDARAEGIRLASETAAHLSKAEGVRGVHIITWNKFELVEEIIKSSGIARS